MGNLQGTLGRALSVPGWDRIQGRGVSLEPLWLTGSLLVSSTLGLAEKRGQEEEEEGKEDGGREGRKEERRLAPITRPITLLDHLERITYGAIRYLGP